jgi:hypothetical protein
MKILMPFLSLNGNTVDSDVVLGGIERFQQLVYKNIPGIIPVNVTKVDSKLTRDSASIIRDAIEKHQPDALFTNHMNSSLSKNSIKYGIKMIHVHHEPVERAVQIIGVCTNLMEMRDKGVDLYFVSQHQYEFYDATCKRLFNKSLGNISGFVNSSYSDNVGGPDENIEYDISTIGRNIPSKDPFWVHRKLQNSKLNSIVLTSKPQKYVSEDFNKYVVSNEHWSPPRHTLYGLSHSDNMKMIAKSHSFVSTWPLESWGITALESLSHGIPTILLTDNTNKHASEAIAADSSHILKLKKSSTLEEVESAINTFKELSHQDRVAIAEATKTKHSKEKWVKSISDMFKDVKTGSGYNPFGTTNLFSF